MKHTLKLAFLSLITFSAQSLNGAANDDFVYSFLTQDICSNPCRKHEFRFPNENFLYNEELGYALNRPDKNGEWNPVLPAGKNIIHTKAEALACISTTSRRKKIEATLKKMGL